MYHQNKEARLFYIFNPSLQLSRRKSLKKQNILKKGIPAIVVVIMPLVVAYGIYGWIILDSVRTAQHITDLIM